MFSLLSPAATIGQAVLALLTVPAAPPITRTLDIRIVPVFNAAHYAKALEMSLVIESPDIRAGGVLLSLDSMIGNVPTYNGSGLAAWDDAGSLELEISVNPSTALREWKTSRKTIGNVAWNYTAYPRMITPDVKPGPRADLRTDQGGLIGAGSTFIPLPPLPDTLLHDIRLHWDLSKSPPKTRPVWTFGDSVSASKKGPISLLQSTYFAVGPVQAYTSDNGQFGVYWFGEPRQFNTTQLAIKLLHLFLEMGRFYGKGDESYRIFIRRSTVRIFGGR
jgi:hypothetical protein